MIKIEVQDIFFGTDKAVPCELINNELLSSSLKHAFPLDRAGERITDYSREEIRRMTFADLIAPEHLDFVRRKMEEKVEGGGETTYEYKCFDEVIPEIESLKIDRSFVRDSVDDGDDAAIIDGIVTLAHALRLKVIAECVEIQAQSELLQRLECDEAQGFLFGRPQPADEIRELMLKEGKS